MRILALAFALAAGLAAFSHQPACAQGACMGQSCLSTQVCPASCTCVGAQPGSWGKCW